MQPTGQLPTQRAFWQKQIPTLAGLAVLIVALVAGLVMFGTGTGVFAPRATAQTTPKQVKITNISDKLFTVSFYTDEATAGFVKYGTDATSLKTQASDDRDQLAGSVGKFTLHHITIKSLKPSTQYFFTLGTGSGADFDNNGAPFSIKTAADPGTPPPVAKTVYGSVMTAGGTPAEGSIVYLAAEGGNELSALVKSSGSWAISLANARTSDGSGYLPITDDTALTFFIQGTTLDQTSQLSSSVKDAQPLADVSLGTSGTAAAQPTTVPNLAVASDSAIPNASPSANASASSGINSADLSGLPAATFSASTQGSSSASVAADASPSSSPSADVTPVAVASPSAILDLTQLASSAPAPAPVIDTPKIMGMAAPSVQVKIQIHSQTAIDQTVTADANGNFQVDVSQLQNLEPGQHTITYSYTDPTTGQEVTKTNTFTVAAKQQLALAATATPTLAPTKTPTKATTSKKASSSAFGSGNPYPITSPTPDTSTRSAVVSTSSGTFTSGSVGETIALIGGGFFLVALGWWSWWLAGQVREELD